MTAKVFQQMKTFKYVKPQTFAAKQKQYTVLTSGINRYWAMAWAWTDLHLAGHVAINWNVHVLWH